MIVCFKKIWIPILSAFVLLISGCNSERVMAAENEQHDVFIDNSDITEDYSIPDSAGMTLKGRVHVDGVGLENVVVSDGVEVTVTDAEGVYYLPSKKNSGYVFISVPGNYEVPSINRIPQFFKKINGSPSVEVNDFELIHVNNDEHVLIAMADLHLANRNNDLSQFKNGFVRDVNKLVENYVQQGKKVYGLTLGDLTWDRYWYSNNFDLSDYVRVMQGVNFDVFNVIGNHDNDPYSADDWLSEDNYRKYIGPTYYSFNLGKVHYIVLDNTKYINKGGSDGIIGDRSYQNKIVKGQMDWLIKDLANIQDKNMPIVIAMHIPMHRNPTIDSEGRDKTNYVLEDSEEFLDAIKDFKNIQILSGHTHINYRINNSEASVKEINLAAVCATWWWTGRKGYSNNHICKDGSPGGYGVWEVKGENQNYFYKSIGYEESYQFRSYDLNEVHITAEKYVPKAMYNFQKELIENYAKDYSQKSDANEVLLNIWGYEEDWKVEVMEGEKKLVAERVRARDPLHLISYMAQRYNRNLKPSFNTALTAHFFKVKASSATSTLNIRVTDSFGKVYEEQMIRPKEFSYSIR